MLARILGFGMGLGLVGAGIYELTMPKTWSQKAAELADDYLPDPARSTCLEFTRLSPDAVRLMGAAKIIVGWALVKMAF